MHFLSGMQEKYVTGMPLMMFKLHVSTVKIHAVGCLNMHGSGTEQTTEVIMRMCCIPTETRD